MSCARWVPRAVLYGALAALAVLLLVPVGPDSPGQAHPLEFSSPAPSTHIDTDHWTWLTVSDTRPSAVLRFLQGALPVRAGPQGSAAMHQSVLLAAALASRFGGEDPTRALLVHDPVHPRASTALRTGDLITHVNGSPAPPATLLSGVLGSAVSTAILTVYRDGETLTVPVAPVTTPAGVSLGWMTEASFAPPVREVQTDNVEGGSAGLLFTLAYLDAGFEGDLTAGRRVAATGVITSDGSVFPVQGVVRKVEAAAASGASLVFVPWKNAPEARKALAGSTQIVPVGTVWEALEVLCRAASDGACRLRDVAH